MFPKSNMSFWIYKDIEGLDRSQKCIYDNLWNAKSGIQERKALNVLSFHFKQLNDNLNSFPNPSSSNMHCIPMDTYLESFNCMKISKESKATFLKYFQNKSPKLSNESLEFQKSRFLFFKQINDNLDNFPNPSSCDMHCIPMDTNLESSIARKM